MRNIALVFTCLVCTCADAQLQEDQTQTLASLLLALNPGATFSPSSAGALQGASTLQQRTGAAVMKRPHSYAEDPYALPEGGYAIVEAQGKQFWLSEKRWYDFDRIPLEPGESFNLNKILFVKKEGEDETYVGRPYLQDWTIEGHVLRHLRTKKVRVFKFKPKKGYRRTYGHRAYKTRCLITAIKKTGETKDPPKEKTEPIEAFLQKRLQKITGRMESFDLNQMSWQDWKSAPKAVKEEVKEEEGEPVWTNLEPEPVEPKK
mmetsp:Transcript_102201/g.196149  ORF Transcript_102201/g.196149 Transcript_102201/m.196149 type:complete len:261 (+) Transcript_102201:70-852(+)